MAFYNQMRPHSALGGKPPAVVYWLRNETTQSGPQERKVAQGQDLSNDWGVVQPTAYFANNF